MGKKEVVDPWVEALERDWQKANEEKTESAINPNHYRQGNIEVIDFIEDQKMDYKEGNIIKYVSRYKYKNGVEDLLKAKWYLDRLLEENHSLPEGRM